MGYSRTYQIDYAGTVECPDCGAKVEFKENQVFKFCSDCGNQINKLRLGYSSWDYASVMKRELKAKLGDVGPWYFKQRSHTGDRYKELFWLKKVELEELSAYADSPKVIIKLQEKLISVEVADYSETNDIDHAKVSIRNFGGHRIELKDKELYDISEKDLREKVYRKAKDLYYDEITEEEYRKLRKDLYEMRLTDILDKYRPRKDRRKK